jgi:hypothetical protein
MADDSCDGRKSKVPAAATTQPSLGGIWLVALACFPYALLVAALPGVGDFPNEGGGEARIGWGFQQLWAYVACGTTLILLSLALWRASRAGGIPVSVRWAFPILVPAAGVAMALAIDQSFEQPGPWLPLVPLMLPPAIGLYALWGCLPALSGRLPGGMARAWVDGVAIGAIAVLSLAVFPLWALDDASYPGRLERHHAEVAAADAAAQAAGEQEDQALRTKFARLGPDASLRDYIGGEYRYLPGVDVLAGARQVKSRQRDAIAMLDEGEIFDLSDLWQLDLEATPILCQAYGKALVAKFGGSEIRLDAARLSLLKGQFPNMGWLRERGCDLDGAVAEIDARLRWMIESPDPSGATTNDSAAYYSRWSVSREEVQERRAELAGFRSAR